MQTLDTLAAHYVQEANKEKKSEKKRELFTKATVLVTTADKIVMHNARSDHFAQYVTGVRMLRSMLIFQTRAGTCLFLPLRRRQDRAGKRPVRLRAHSGTIQHSITAGQSLHCIQQERLQVPLSVIEIEWNEWNCFSCFFLPRGALAFYKKALRTNPNCPASVRLGLGLCFLKLGNESKARDAFERAQELDGNCIGALVGQAILDLNTQKKKAIQDGVKKLSKVRPGENRTIPGPAT